MMSRTDRLCTARLLLIPMGEREMEELAREESDMHLRAAYGEMLTGMRDDPAHALWYTNWTVALRDGTVVGGAGFHGAPNDMGQAELGYGIRAAYGGQGYATEAAKALGEWALCQPGCTVLLAQTEPDHAASIRVLQKCGYRLVGNGAEGLLWQLDRCESPTAEGNG